ncbi:MAG: transcriptional repressor [Leptospiraceae bacterium]|nr:transcriptional repressor [Leptospiraceae bacterium]MDW8307294.1 transcriptional repressor [Leptospiraceae bacterium]
MPEKRSAPRLGSRLTKQREVIVKLFEETPRPLRLQEIHHLAQKKIPAMGIATVYRTVKILRQVGFLRVVHLPGGGDCYEKEGLRHHHHFQCRHCGKVFDLPECTLRIDLGKMKEEGFQAESHELVVFGSCPPCNRRARGV